NVQLGVEVLDEQDEAEVGVLQLVLVAGVLADSSGVPTLPSEIDNGARLLEQHHDFGADQPPVELADGIHATPQKADMAQIDKPDFARVDEKPTLFILGSRLDVDPVEVFRLHPVFPNSLV